MTRPPVRSLPTTRRHDRTGHSFVPSHLCLPAAFGKTPSKARPVAFGCLPLSIIRYSGQRRDRFTTPAVDQNSGLNAHVSSAVPFNLLFPHS